MRYMKPKLLLVLLLCYTLYHKFISRACFGYEIGVGIPKLISISVALFSTFRKACNTEYMPVEHTQCTCTRLKHSYLFSQRLFTFYFCFCLRFDLLVAIRVFDEFVFVSGFLRILNTNVIDL